MKITISYLPEERHKANAITTAICHYCPGTRVHESDRYPPRKHTYLTIRKTGEAHENRSGI